MGIRCGGGGDEYGRPFLLDGKSSMALHSGQTGGRSRHSFSVNVLTKAEHLSSDNTKVLHMKGMLEK